MGERGTNSLMKYKSILFYLRFNFDNNVKTKETVFFTMVDYFIEFVLRMLKKEVNVLMDG